MNATIQIDTRGFEAMVSGLTSALGKFNQMPSTKNVLDVLTRRILEGCIRRTKMATAASIRKFFKSKGNSAHTSVIAMSVNDGSRGGVPGRVWYGEDPAVSSTVTAAQREALQRRAKKGGKVWVAMDETINPGKGMLRRFQALDADRVANIKGVLKRKLEAALAARGLARNSWLQIAQKLGITLSSIAGGAQVAKARPSTGASYSPGNGIRVEGPAQLYYEISNSYPFSKFKIPGAEILSRAIQGELGYFRNNFKHGVFNDLAAIAKKYKGITVS